MKYAPKKVFVLINGNYEEITYEELCDREENDVSYADKHFLPLYGMLLEVDRLTYDAFYKDKRRQKYIAECARENGAFSYDSLDTAEFCGEDILMDSRTDVAEEAVLRIMTEKVRSVLLLLSPDDMRLIAALYYDGMTEREYAKQCGVYHNAIHKRKMRILSKLRNLIEK